MKYIRAIDEKNNEILLSSDLKREYTISYINKYGSKNIKESAIIGLIGAILGISILNYYVDWGVSGGILGFAVFFLWKYFVSRRSEKTIVEV